MPDFNSIIENGPPSQQALRRWYLEAMLPSTWIGWACLGGLLLSAGVSLGVGELSAFLGWSMAAIWYLHSNVAGVLAAEAIKDYRGLCDDVATFLRGTS